MPHVITNTPLWKISLGSSIKGEAGKALERLRQTFLRFRERGSLLVGEIHCQLPDLTVHDVTHLDSLWEMASLIAGPKFRLTPTEAFVFGGAVKGSPIRAAVNK